MITNGNAKVHLYKLVNPPSGTGDVVVTLDANPDKGIIVGVTTYTGVDQTVPLGSFSGAEDNSITPSLTVSSAAGELVHDVISFRNVTLTVGTGQTQLWNVSPGSEANGGGSTEPGAASVTMSWTPSGSQDWAMAGISIKRATLHQLDRIDPVATSDFTTAQTSVLSDAASTIKVDNTSSNSWGNAGQTSFTVSHNTGTGIDKLMLVGISQKNKEVISVTYNGIALDLVGEDISNGNARMHMYSL